MSEQWLSIVEYARQFNMSDMTVRRRIKTGKIQAVLRDGKYYIPMSEALRKLSHSQSQPQQQQQAAPAPQMAAVKQNYQRQATHEPMKSHPLGERSYEKTYMQTPIASPIHHVPPHPTMQQHYSAPAMPDPVAANVPQHLRSAIVGHGGASVDSSTLIAFCEGALKKSVEAEQRLESLYKETIGKLEAEIRSKDHQIKALSQQVEDLQLLTKILERKK